MNPLSTIWLSVRHRRSDGAGHRRALLPLIGEYEVDQSLVATLSALALNAHIAIAMAVRRKDH
ncbi:hypothetical protein F2981_33590 (plasmid) [Sinorhizobium meliloti]|nr:hypothetical protein [Sinorhizobium meliloti]